ncbi:MAG: hypothetical protein P1P89_15910 [Desulfobacterales bacterium]|nr:hypothetical protein [Desulfobacterales bacterium]
MRVDNCRIYPSYNIKVNAKAVTANRTVPSIATEISADRVSIQTDRPIMPTTPINICIQLEEDIQLQGNVVWVLDTQTDKGEHYYLAGIRTDAIIHPKVKAIGRAEKARLLQEMLYEIMERCNN